MQDLRNHPTQKRSPAGNLDYSYDLSGQLTGVVASNGASASLNENFSYDSIGNRMTDKNGNYVYDNVAQRLKEDYSFFYFYDNNGNLTSKVSKDLTKESFNFTYSSKNQLIKIRVTTGPLESSELIRQVDYQYDVVGRRMQKSVWKKDVSTGSVTSYSRKYIYNGDNVFAEYDSENKLLAKYVHSPLMADDILEAEITADGVTASLAQAAGKYEYLKDSLGTITDIADTDGNIVQRYEYASFGGIAAIKDSAGADLSVSPKVSTSFTFTGREWDPEAGLYYYRARSYDPTIGRFLQVDPDPGSQDEPSSINSKYQYVKNMPSILSDPSGKVWWLIAFAIVGAVSGYTAGVKAGLSGLNLLGATILGAITSVAAPYATPALGVGWGIAIGGLAGAANQIGLQVLAFGRVVDESRVWAGGGAGIVGGSLGYGGGKLAYDLGFNIGVRTTVDNAVSIGLGAIGGPLAIPTPTQDDVRRYRDARGTNTYKNPYSYP